jgi:hypothetical protein
MAKNEIIHSKFFNQSPSALVQISKKELFISQSNNNLHFNTLSIMLEKIIMSNSKNISKEQMQSDRNFVLNQLGINLYKNNGEISVNSILTTAKMKMNHDKVGYIYKQLINLLSSPLEKLVKILQTCIEKFKIYKDDDIIKDLEWALSLINVNRDGFLNYYTNQFDTNEIKIKDNDDLQLIEVYSNEPNNLSKEQDMKKVRVIIEQRNNMKRKTCVPNIFGQNKLNGYNDKKFMTIIERSGGKSKTFHEERSDGLDGKIISDKNSNKGVKKKNKRDELHKAIQEYQPNDYHVDLEEHKIFEFDSNEEPSDYNNSINNSFSNIDSFSDIEIQNKSEIDINNNEEQNNKPDVKPKTPLKSPFAASNKHSSNSSTLIPKIEIDHLLLQEDKNPIRSLQIDNISFNIFNYCSSVGRDKVLPSISFLLMIKYDFFQFINAENFATFIDKIRIGYDESVPYHNDLHATDVLQTTHFIINNTQFKQELDLTSLDLCALFLSCIVHDFKHPGLNNAYLINSRHKIALTYNDSSVLEQYHISSAFKIISQHNANIFVDITKEEYRIVRKRMVECVLSTDMARHTKAVTLLKAKIDQIKTLVDSTGNSLLELLVNYVPNDTKFDRQQFVLNYVMHCADISNTAKPFHIAGQWTKLLMKEFFEQGDIEKKEGLSVTFLCDRETTNVAKSQISFINNILEPAFKLLGILVPQCKVFINNIKDNIKNWEEIEKKGGDWRELIP